MLECFALAFKRRQFPPTHTHTKLNLAKLYLRAFAIFYVGNQRMRLQENGDNNT